MELIKKDYLNNKKFFVKSSSEAGTLAKEISFSYGLYFGRVMGMIKRNGIQCIRECFNESKKAPRQPAVGLFIWLVKKNTTPLEEVKTEKTVEKIEKDDGKDYSYSTCRRILTAYGRSNEYIDRLLGNPYL